MTQEEKEFLIKDLCGRLSYGLIIKCNDGFRQSKEKLVSIDVGNGLINYDWRLTDIKPYLRPLSSMTEEERGEYNMLYYQVPIQRSNGNAYRDTKMVEALHIEWLNKNMFDYRGLIPKGLALESTKGMYENETDSVIDNATKITVGCKIRSKTNPDVILRIVSNDCHGDKFECSNGSVLSLRQINKYYDIYIEENKGTIVIN